MVITVTDNSPKSINTSLFSLEKQIEDIESRVDKLIKLVSGIDTSENVISVNGKQGIVELNAQDVGALSNDTVIPSRTSQLANDSGYITASEVGTDYVPVTRTVNNKALSSNITLTASDVGALPDTTHIPVDPVQSDWNETDPDSLAYIQNKPNIPSGVVVDDAVTDGDMNAVTSNAVFQAFVSSDQDKYGTFGLLGGCNQSSKGNFTDLIHEISTSTGMGGLCGGSINTTTTSLGVAAGWYNFLYIPHRTGRGGDNYRYGTLLIFPMTSNANNFYVVHHVSGSIYNALSFRYDYSSSAGTATTANRVRTSQPSSLTNGDIWVV